MLLIILTIALSVIDQASVLGHKVDFRNLLVKCEDKSVWVPVTLKKTEPYYLQKNGISAAFKSSSNSCVSFPINYGPGRLEFSVYVETVSNDSGINILVFDEDNEIPAVYEYRKYSKEFEPGWRRILLPIEQKTIRHVTILGFSKANENVIIESIVFINKTMQNNDTAKEIDVNATVLLVNGNDYIINNDYPKESNILNKVTETGSSILSNIVNDNQDGNNRKDKKDSLNINDNDNLNANKIQNAIDNEENSSQGGNVSQNSINNQDCNTSQDGNDNQDINDSQNCNDNQNGVDNQGGGDNQDENDNHNQDDNDNQDGGDNLDEDNNQDGNDSQDGDGNQDDNDYQDGGDNQDEDNNQDGNDSQDGDGTQDDNNNQDGNDNQDGDNNQDGNDNNAGNGIQDDNNNQDLNDNDSDNNQGGNDNEDNNADQNGIEEEDGEIEQDSSIESPSNFWNSWTITLVAVGSALVAALLCTAAYHIGKIRGSNKEVEEIFEEDIEAPRVIPRVKRVYDDPTRFISTFGKPVQSNMYM